MFPDLQPGSCAAVSLARFAQEPLMEYCALWTCADSVEVFGYEALYLDLHPLKVRSVPPL
jgi:transcriptional accessory protein Tex/SPT6